MQRTPDQSNVAELKRLHLDFLQKLEEAKLEIEGILRKFDQNLRERRVAQIRKELDIDEKTS